MLLQLFPPNQHRRRLWASLSYCLRLCSSGPGRCISLIVDSTEPPSSDFRRSYYQTLFIIRHWKPRFYVFRHAHGTSLNIWNAFWGSGSSSWWKHFTWTNAFFAMMLSVLLIALGSLSYINYCIGSSCACGPTHYRPYSVGNHILNGLFSIIDQIICFTLRCSWN